ncbi:hypothetical protein OOZ15_11790 [Galbibacter sp. EGI 63066]|uniref:hypothetical protein n=1 Tax=Galbibacter sp. EGI 63066 TaxID=2993559 RepID=UPI0022491B5A|nr:hypothetical protein [Galbibacter sp. EGI 63066]MCX2680625.1 hypothetical protein [Galbibacter sp. EGI 63066]
MRKLYFLYLLIPIFSWSQTNTFPDSGNVGIGTTNPSSTLEVKSDVNSDSRIHINTATDGDPSIIRFQDSGVTTWGFLANYPSQGKFSLYNYQKGSHAIILNENSDVGIGASNPQAKLHIYDSDILGNNAGDFHLLYRLQGRSSHHFMENTWLLRDANGTGWLQARLHNGISIDASFLTPGVNTRTWWERDPYDDVQSWGNGSEAYMSLIKGKLGIGTVNTGSHKLAVEGSVGAREVKVEASNWSDFVFEKNYDLPTLEEVERHIQEKGHLQDIPSAEEVEKNGIYLGEMDAKLLQKIEELTLYTIEQEREIKQQQSVNKNHETENIEQEKEIKELKAEIAELKKQSQKIEELEKKLNQFINTLDK